MADFLACPDPGGRSGRLERQLEQQKGNLEQLILQNEKLNQRDALRIATAKAALDTALSNPFLTSPTVWLSPLPLAQNSKR